MKHVIIVTLLIAAAITSVLLHSYEHERALKKWAIAIVVRSEGVTNVTNPRAYLQNGLVRVEFDSTNHNESGYYGFGYAEVLSDGRIKEGHAMYPGL